MACKICEHPHLSKITAGREKGQSLRELGFFHSVQPKALSQHFKNCGTKNEGVGVGDCETMRDLAELSLQKTLEKTILKNAGGDDAALILALVAVLTEVKDYELFKQSN